MRLVLPVILLACAFVAGSVSAEMLKYTDSDGRLRFVQDISQVPPEYRHQVQKQRLGREISVTGGASAPTDRQQRVEEMERRSRRLKAATRARRPAPPAAPAAPKNHLVGAPEPVKYHRECWWQGSRKKCTKTLTAAWQRWDAANGGDNGKPVTRRKIGK